jgi:hypothetical protein
VDSRRIHELPENLFIEYHEGKAAGHEYIIGCRRNIANDRPIIGDYDVNKEGSKDMYCQQICSTIIRY